MADVALALGVQDAQHCVKTDPTFVKGYARLSSCLRSKGRPADAFLAAIEGSKVAAEHKARTGIEVGRSSCALCREAGQLLTGVV